MSEQTVCDITPLEYGALRRVCTQEEVASAADTHGASVLDDMFIGVDQKRFSQALAFGLDAASKSHVFIAGISGPQALNAVKTFMTSMLTSRVPGAGDLPDLCCLYNFANPLQPITITLPKGKGKVLQQRMQSLLTQLQERIPVAMVRDEIVAQRQQINTEFWSWWEAKRLEIIQEARTQGILVVFQENQAIVNPFSRKQKKAKMDYEVSASGSNEEDSVQFMGTEERDALPFEQRHALQTAKNQWMRKVTMTFVEHTRRIREAGEKIVALNQKVVSEVVHEAFGVLGISDKRAYAYTDHLKQYAIDHMDIFNLDYQNNQNNTSRENMFLPWQVNLMVDHSEHASVPVVVDYDATYEDLVGRIGRIGGSGGFIYTDHTMISAGSIASANHGYLLVDAMNLLRSTGSYLALKRVLATNILTIEDLKLFPGMASSIPLQPMPIPVNIKVIMVGLPFLWGHLVQHDPDFLEYFEKAEIAPSVNRTEKEISALASWTRQYGQLNNLLPFQDDALGKIVEHAGRLADRQDKLSVDFARLESIVAEASYLAHGEQSPITEARHVRRAIENKFYRSNLSYERMQQMIRDQTIILPLKGEAVGQMTLLSVRNLGDIHVGFPGRITAEWSVGRPGFISIHREAGLAGEILKKGELTVQGYLRALFAKRYPMAVNITYNPEQTYGGVDGDSASLALFYAIVSALSDIPLRQDIAITGSMPQRGAQAQAIGGVNEKIEGFFDVCALTGFTGTQGVIIPQANARDLMLGERVVEAAQQGLFTIWAITEATEGIRILTGKEAGERKPDFTFTENSVYDTVDKQLQKIAENARNFFKKDADYI